MLDIQKSVSLSQKSDVTGDDIELAKPFVRVDSFNIDKNEIEKFEKMLVRQNKDIYNSYCDMCLENNSILKFNSNHPEHERNLNLCDACYGEVIYEIRKIREDIEETTYYWDSSGVIVFKNTNENRHYTDMIEKREIKNNRVVIGIPLGFRYYLKTKIGNLSELCDRLKNARDSRLTDCCKCGSHREVKQIDNANICANCRDKIIECLEEVREECSDLIVADRI